ncbi:Tox-REase-5 domain-containing protein [Orbus wheelerorum]|uniref:Tox-REase-5 domain-containing protein n=1 Tax=Orbus wheelerorum TaxID=3074111 RepID=UPI00370DC570
MSALSADYQGALSGESWQRTMNPKSGKISLEMKEWLYVGPAGRADFDGWLERFCLLLEMKANYDSLMFSRTEFVDIAKMTPKLKALGRDKIDSFTKQAGRHNKICLRHPYVHCCWIFMTPFAYNAFLDILKVNSYQH